MTRLFYVALGAGVGIVLVRRASRLAKAWTPAGVAAQAGTVGEQLAAWWSDVQTFSAQRETELRDALGLAPAADSAAQEDPDAHR